MHDNHTMRVRQLSLPPRAISAKGRAVQGAGTTTGDMEGGTMGFLETNL